MNYTTKVGKPTAHVTKKKSRLKVYNGHNVFLNDKDNFEFEIHNPTQKTVLAKIKLNGEYISTSGIVLRPGERVFLERFLDTNNKFEFSTYKVTNTSENRSAIDLNGDVLVEFYDEQIWYPSNISNQSFINTWTNFNSTDNIRNHGIGFTTTSLSTDGLLSSSETLYFSDALNKNIAGRNPFAKHKSKKIETGRVEKGEVSNQSFTTVSKSFNYYTSHVVRYKILPLSSKNIEAHEIRRYCTECGAKLKKNYKFCPSCGAKL
jgi:Zn finger protein HypA/HybF involved in hydrogenase expression